MGQQENFLCCKCWMPPESCFLTKINFPNGKDLETVKSSKENFGHKNLVSLVSENRQKLLIVCDSFQNITA